jgi:hypothetical protein
MTVITDFDHCMILVRDLEAADRQFGKLGFTTTPRGLHSERMGTANSTIVFRDHTYLEPLGIVAPTPDNEAQRERLAQGEGIYGLAFKTPDGVRAAEQFEALGIAQGKPIEFARPVDLPNGVFEAMFTVARTRPGAVPGAWLFACHHHTPDLVWREDALDHPNGALGIEELVGRADDLGEVAEGWRPIFGDRLEDLGTELVLRTGTAAIRFLRAADYGERFGRAAAADGGAPRLVAVRIGVADLGRALELWREAGVPIEHPEANRVVVPAGEACGVALEFVPAH